MNIYNRVDCGTGGRNKNTGFGDCIIDPKLITGGAYVPSTFKLTKAQLQSPATVIAALKAAAKADLPEDRIYPIHGFINPADNSEGKQVRTTNDGSQSVTRDGLVKWSWEFTQGGLKLLIALRSHNANSGYFIFWDADYTLFGWGRDSELYGIPLNYRWSDSWKQNDGTNPAIYPLEVAFFPRYINEELGFVRLNANLADVKGLRDVNIVINDFNGDEGTGNFSLLTEDSAYNLYDRYSDEFAAPALYLAVDDASGNQVTISDVTKKASDKSFDFALDTGDADYPLTDGDAITLSLVTVSALEAAGITGFEGVDATLTIESGSGS